MKLFFTIVIMCIFLNGCVSKSEKAKNTIPYKYRTAEHVKIACDNQMKRNSNSKANATPFVIAHMYHNSITTVPIIATISSMPSIFYSLSVSIVFGHSVLSLFLIR